MSFLEREIAAFDGLSLHYRDYGDALSPEMPVLCLPGLTRNCKDFEVLAERLSATRRVLCTDYRGRGRSGYDTDWRNYRAEIIVRDLTDLMAAVDLHRVAVIGTSFGGILGLGLCVAAPRAVCALVLNEAGPELETAGLATIIQGIRRDRPQPDWDSAERALAKMFPNLTFRDEETWRTAVRNTFRLCPDGLLHIDWDPKVVKPLLHGMRSVALWPLFHAAGRVPMLAIRGAQSEVLSAAAFDRMAAARPDLIRLTVAGTAHAPSLDEPEARTAIDEFLARC